MYGCDTIKYKQNLHYILPIPTLWPSDVIFRVISMTGHSYVALFMIYTENIEK